MRLRAVNIMLVPFSTRYAHGEQIRKMVGAPPPNEHLGLFCRNKKTQAFASFTTNGNTARVKIAPVSR
jgi:hypothetical protein